MSDKKYGVLVCVGCYKLPTACEKDDCPTSRKQSA